MNHPIIANENAKARYNEFLYEAEQYRLESKVTKRHGLAQLLSMIISLFI
ncbi:MAG: hypothetical protein H6658_14735 [Ardenticatenaceae bacterium]|nr:hypothetical protein [Ardenticatenaceae bacterium]